MTRESWTYLTNHSHLLACLARDENMSLREVATQVGITERAVLHLVADLVEAHVVTRTRVGRRNHYVINRDAPMRHPLMAGATVGDLVDLLDLGDIANSTGSTGTGQPRPRGRTADGWGTAS